MNMYDLLEKFHSRPKPFEFYTAEDLWNNEYTSQKMLQYHLNENIDVSSRKASFIQKSVEWMQDTFHLNETKSVIDFGCGPGLYTSRFSKTGAKVTGIDFSKNSIHYAKEFATENKLNIDYINQNYLSYESDKKFDLITMIMCDFCALSPQQRKSLLDKFNKLLKPEGSILLDVYTLQAFKNREEQTLCEKNLLDGFWSPNDYFGFMNTLKYEDDKVVLDKYTLVDKENIRTVYNWLQYFNQESLRTEFTSCGFNEVHFLGDVSGVEFDPQSDEMAVIVRRQ